MQLFYSTVHSINARDYSIEQLEAWAPKNTCMATGETAMRWGKTLEEHYSLVALEDGVIIGFADLDGDYLDRLYVHKDYQGKGVATVLANALEEQAHQNGCLSIITHASITAKTFFQKRGYAVQSEQQVEKDGILLTNFIMQKLF